MLKEYRMQVGRASVKLEFSEDAEAGLRDRVKAMMEKVFQSRIEEEFAKYEEGCSANYYLWLNRLGVIQFCYHQEKE